MNRFNLVHQNTGRLETAIEFGEIPNFSTLTEQAGKLRYMI